MIRLIEDKNWGRITSHLSSPIVANRIERVHSGHPDGTPSAYAAEWTTSLQQVGFTFLRRHRRKL